MLSNGEISEQLLGMLDEKYAGEHARVAIGLRSLGHSGDVLVTGMGWTWSMSDRRGCSALEVAFSWGKGSTDHGLELRYVIDEGSSLPLLVAEYSDLFAAWGGSLHDGDDERVPAAYCSLVAEVIDAWLDGRLVAWSGRIFCLWYWELREDGRPRSSSNWLLSSLPVRKRRHSPSWALGSDSER